MMKPTWTNDNKNKYKNQPNKQKNPKTPYKPQTKTK